jgi:hypothetical protein
VRSECNSVTRPAETGEDHVRKILEGALQGWQDHPSAADLRRRLLRLILELDEGDGRG